MLAVLSDAVSRLRLGDGRKLLLVGLDSREDARLPFLWDSASLNDHPVSADLPRVVNKNPRSAGEILAFPLIHRSAKPADLDPILPSHSTISNWSPSSSLDCLTSGTPTSTQP
ncbi:hypothetical protein VTJ04DRAFT_10137 [Mycothermus thermophilus]|uniref:uncharacterized protein n=1 Tax=Humicola insolens TaxID=85995 RepID=UPI003742EC0F